MYKKIQEVIANINRNYRRGLLSIVDCQCAILNTLKRYGVSKNVVWYFTRICLDSEWHFETMSANTIEKFMRGETRYYG